MRLGVVTGLTREAACLSDVTGAGNLDIRCSGADPARAGAMAHDLVTGGCRALLSFGIAGGLNPELATGTVIVADEVRRASGENITTSRNWHRRLLAQLPAGETVVAGAVLGSDHMIRSPEDKMRLWKKTRALAVDMESHHVAEVASREGLPFLAVRAISDTADRPLPQWVEDAVAPDGTPRYSKILGELVRRPWTVPEMLTMSRESEAALAALRGVAGRAGSLFAFG